MKRNRAQIRKGIHQIKKDMNSIVKEYGEEIFELTNKLCQEYINIDDKSEATEKEIYDKYYKAFTKAYSKTSASLKNIYNKLSPYNIKKINELTYSEDGKNFEERVQQHFDNTKHKIDANTEQIVKQGLRISLYTILNTEVHNISETVKKNKKPEPEDGLYVIQVIEGCGGDCHHDCIEYNGEYPEDEDIPWPPYHPNCTGIGYYSFTDIPDEIEELDLEDENV